jgi:type IV secretion/conjugal transfer VirB4 family ATPase
MFAEGLYGEPHVRDHLLAHLSTCITGRRHPILLPPCPMYLDAVIGGHELWSGVMPRFEDDYIAVIAIDGFPQASTPGMLHLLDTLPLSHRWSTRFIGLDATDAVSRLKAYRRKWQQKVRGFMDQFFKTGSGVVDQDALRMVGETDDAVAEANSAQVAYGHYTSVVVLMSPDRELLDDQSREVRRAIQNLGFDARLETVNCLEAWLGSLPGHGVPNLRRPLLHTMNLADLLPLAAVWPGREHNPCPFYPPKSPALLHAATEGATPFRLNLHVGDLGHTLIFGPTGAGKSTLLGLIAAQFRRYRRASIFAFDKGKSLLPLTLAAGGAHVDIGADESPLTLCPLAEIDRDADAAWAEGWVGQLLMLQGAQVQAPQRGEIHRAVTLLRQAPPEGRTLTDLAANLQDLALREALEPYTVSGAMGHLLDGDRDTLATSNCMTFEIEALRGMGDACAMPVLLYLFHAIERRLCGQPALLLLDEAWLMLGHPVFRDKIREWLKVLRKANCAVVLATQSLSDAARSGIIDVLVESCPTKILLPNMTAKEETSRPLYEQIGLGERQIELIAQATPKRHYYVVSPEGRRLIDLHLGPLALSFVGASGKDDLEAIKRLWALHGADWPGHWLRERGCYVEMETVDGGGAARARPVSVA